MLKFDKKTLIIVVLLIMVSLLVWGYRNSVAQLKGYKNQISKFEFKEQKYIETIDENGRRVAEQDQIILSQKDAITHNLLEIERLKKISSQVIVNTITEIDSIFVPFIVDTINNDTLVGDNYIIVPKRFSLSDEWYAFNGKIIKNGVLLDSISFNNELKITLGSKSMGIFKRPKPVVLITNSSPYVHTTGLQNIVIKEDLRFYDKKSFWLGVGFIGGIGTSIILSK